MKVTIAKWLTLAAAVFASATAATAFNPPKDTAGPLTIEIAAPDKVEALGKTFATTITLTNSGSAMLDVQLEVWVIDRWYIRQAVLGPRVEQSLVVAAGAKTQAVVKIEAGYNTYNALYPIHARATFKDPALKGTRLEAHAIKIVAVDVAKRTVPLPPSALVAKPGLTPLVRYRPLNIAQIARGQIKAMLESRGSDPETGAMFQTTSVDRGGWMACLAIHPPYRRAAGTISVNYDLVLLETKPITLTFAIAVRDNAPNEPASDGVEFKVMVEVFENDKVLPVRGATLFTRFTKSKTWEPASVDLSPYAGKHIRLQLWAGPGPANDTVCDTGYWGNPTIVMGELPQVASPEQRASLRAKALQIAHEARKGAKLHWGWKTSSEAGTFGLSILPGPQGLADAVIAVAGEKENLLFDGFDIQISGIPLASFPIAKGGEWQSTFENGRGSIEAKLPCAEGPTTVRAELWMEGGALRCRFSMPDVNRDKRGQPRFTLLGLGPGGGAKARRVYAGFGNVIEEPGKFTLSSNAFQLSTRHVGVDYDNGMSLVQASDVFPDRLQVDPDRSLVQLQVHHDATISLIPSEKGAFEAAKVYRENIAGFKPAPSLDKLKGRMCLDYWGTSYQHGIETIEKLAKYGVTDCVYVWHNWQRWGYDYRLPEIYPARGSHEEFLKLAETCRKNGLLFCPHDNYIDFYPDAEGYSYNQIIFNEDGTPQKAWFNKGRNAQSYRWRPDAFQPWLEKNIALLKRDVKPTAYFIDVFTAIEPMDFYDYTGKFHPKTETIRKWYECFDYVREQFGGAPQISEAGSDHHIGHLEAGESDHNGVSRTGARQWEWNAPCADAERTPWHDMASHGSFVLFAGGLASRYVGSLDAKTHGYGSDDYLSLTVLGGRNPMAAGDSSAETILTYWLLHDICAELGKRPMTSHEFADGNIHRQIVHFGDDATVWVNRGKDDWNVADAVLPPYGFVAKAGNVRAEVTRRDGVVCGYAHSPVHFFLDARPPRKSLAESNSSRKVVNFGPVSTNGAIHGTGSAEWEFFPLPGCPASEIRINPSRLANQPGTKVAQIERLDENRKAIGAVEFMPSGEEVVFQTSPDDFGYRIIRTK